MTFLKRSSIPLYYQLENILREKINSGEYRPGGPFPTEEQLVRSYKVSRITVRKALSALETDRLINRKRHIGTFVINAEKPLRPRRLSGMFDDVIDWGVRTEAKVIDFGFIHPPKKVAAVLRLGDETTVLRIERVRLVKGCPVSYSVSYIPPELGKRIRIKDLRFKTLLNVLEEKYKVEIGRGGQIIEATIADSRIASLLKIMTGAPLLKIERAVFDTKDKPVEYIFILYRSDRYYFSVNLLRKKSKSKGRWDYARADNLSKMPWENSSLITP